MFLLVFSGIAYLFVFGFFFGIFQKSVPIGSYNFYRKYENLGSFIRIMCSLFWPIYLIYLMVFITFVGGSVLGDKFSEMI